MELCSRDFSSDVQSAYESLQVPSSAQVADPADTGIVAAWFLLRSLEISSVVCSDIHFASFSMSTSLWFVHVACFSALQGSMTSAMNLLNKLTFEQRQKGAALRQYIADNRVSLELLFCIQNYQRHLGSKHKLCS
ncbi:hypothetical protein AK812_SmicGene47036 [Symbiodinium microadriaticum]|uniref:Uncharacterized protein n=1 Tax=Symbiodinium microadriaticum TaxID=2951 RepID=A0A1Q9BSI9_SYMMI|nr:hypothetical protein AK812_SmicGene47036 [Symbiodinium microadriaticum]